MGRDLARAAVVGHPCKPGDAVEELNGAFTGPAGNGPQQEKRQSAAFLSASS